MQATLPIPAYLPASTPPCFSESAIVYTSDVPTLGSVPISDDPPLACVLGLCLCFWCSISIWWNRSIHWLKVNNGLCLHCGVKWFSSQLPYRPIPIQASFPWYSGLTYSIEPGDHPHSKFISLTQNHLQQKYRQERWHTYARFLIRHETVDGQNRTLHIVV